MNLAHPKGIMQEVVVFSRRPPQALADPSSVFGAQSISQPESVVLHSVELPQVQLGDREDAESFPENGDTKQKTRQGVSQTLDLPAHPALLHLQQQRLQQSLQPHILTSSGAHSAPLNDAASQRAVSRINSLSSLSSEYLRASKREGSSQAATAAALQAQQSSSMSQWGLPHGSVALSGNPVDYNRSHSAHMAHMHQATGQPHGAHAFKARVVLPSSPTMHNSALLATGQPDCVRKPLVGNAAWLCKPFSGDTCCDPSTALSYVQMPKTGPVKSGPLAVAAPHPCNAPQTGMNNSKHVCAQGFSVL